MPRQTIHHPIQQAIEDIWKAGHTPRIQVDARRDDVSVPESVKSRWGARLVLDLDASWPLNLEYGAEGISVDLAFQGHVSRCTLPWTSIYVVLDRATGRGVVIESHLPKADLPAESARPSARPTPVAVPPVEASAGRSTPPSEPASASSEEEAQRRRARFKVIDGGR